MTIPKRPTAVARAVLPVVRAMQRKTAVVVPAPYSPVKSPPERAIVSVPKPFMAVQTKAGAQPAALSGNQAALQAKTLGQRSRPIPPQVAVFAPGHQGPLLRTPVVGQKRGPGAIVQRSAPAASSASQSKGEEKSAIPPDRYPRPMADMDVASLAVFHKEGKDEELLTDAVLKKIGANLYSLTPFINSVNCNCYSWALGDNHFQDPGGKLSTWKFRLGAKYSFSEPPASNAKIILWGIDNDEVTHASVLLTHEELLARAKSFSLPIEKDLLKRQLKNIGNPCWTSASGMGFGIYIHPKDWFEGGAFGKALAGML